MDGPGQGKVRVKAKFTCSSSLPSFVQLLYLYFYKLLIKFLKFQKMPAVPGGSNFRDVTSVFASASKGVQTWYTSYKHAQILQRWNLAQ